jgi:hypothetical protein
MNEISIGFFLIGVVSCDQIIMIKGDVHFMTVI